MRRITAHPLLALLTIVILLAGALVTALPSTAQDSGSRIRITAQNAAQLQQQTTLKGGGLSAAFSPDGAILALPELHTYLYAVDSQITLQRDLDTESRSMGLSFNRDGTLLAIGSGPFKVTLWNVKTGSAQDTLTLDNGSDLLALSPDGSTVATTNPGDGDIQLWDVQTGKVRTTLHSKQPPVESLAFSPDGSLLAHGSLLWDLKSATVKATLQGSIEALAFSPDGSLLACGMDSGQVKLWDVKANRWHVTGSGSDQLPGHSRDIMGLAFSPDGSLLASASVDGTSHIWDIATGASKARLTVMTSNGFGAIGVAFSPDGTRLATSLGDPVNGMTTLIWALPNDSGTSKGTSGSATKAPTIRSVATKPTTSAAVTPLPATGTLPEAPVARLMDDKLPAQAPAITGSNLNQLMLTAALDGAQIAWSGDGKTYAITGKNQIEAYHADPTDPYLKTIPLPEGSSASQPPRLALNRDGTLIALAIGNTVHLWNVDTGQEQALPATIRGASCPTFSPNGTTLAVSASASVNTLNLSTNQVDTYKVPDQLTTHGCLVFSPDGLALIANGQSTAGNIVTEIWAVPIPGTRSLGLSRLKATLNYPMELTFSPDMKLLAAAFQNNISIWDLTSGRQQLLANPPGGSNDGALGISFSADGTLIAASNGGETARVWDTKSGNVLAVLRGDPAGPINHLQFSPDGRFLSADGGSWERARVWIWSVGQPGTPLPTAAARVATQPVGPLAGSAALNAGNARQAVQVGRLAKDISALAWSPNGKVMAIGGLRSGLSVIAMSNPPRPLFTLDQLHYIESLAFSPDGALLAAGLSDGTINLLDAATGDTRFTLSGHADSVRSLAFSPDGALLASGSADHTVNLWDVKSGKAVSVLNKHKASVDGVTFSPDGALLASRSADGSVRLWDVKTGQTVARLLTDDTLGLAGGLAFSPDGSLLAFSGGVERGYRLYDLKTGQYHLKSQDNIESVTQIAFSPDGSLLAMSASQGVALLDIKANRVLVTLQSPVSVPHSLVFSPDGSLLAAADDQVMQVWGLKQSEQAASGVIAALAAPAANNPGAAPTAAPVESVSALPVISAANANQLAELSHVDNMINDLAWSPDSKSLALADDRGIVALVPPSNLTSPVRNLNEQNRVAAVAYSSDGSAVASVSVNSSQVHLWDPATGQQKNSITLKSVPAHLAFSPDGSLLAGLNQSSIELWHLKAGHTLRTLNMPANGALTAYAFSGDGRYLATTSGSDSSRWTVQVWDIKAGSARPLADYKNGLVVGLAFSADSKSLYTVSQDSTVQTWDLATGHAQASWDGSVGPLSATVFSPDRSLVATTTYVNGKNVLRLWNLTSGAMLTSIDDHVGLAFSPDGTMLAGFGRVRADVLSAPAPLVIPPTPTASTATAAPTVVAMAPTAAVGSAAAVITARNADRLALLTRFGHGVPDDVAWSPDGKSLAITTPLGVELQAADGSGALRWFADETAESRHVLFSPDGSLLAVGRWSVFPDATIRLVNVQSGAEVAVIQAPPGEAPGTVNLDQKIDPDVFAFSPDGSLLAHVTGKDVALWDVKSQAESGWLSGHTDRIIQLVFSPDGKILASASQDQTVRLWDVKSQKLLTTLQGSWQGLDYSYPEFSLAFSPDGSQVFIYEAALQPGAARKEAALETWTVQDGKQVARTALSDVFGAAVFSPDRTELAFCDSPVRLVDLKSGQAVRTLDFATMGSCRLNFSPDGKTLAAAGVGVGLWDVKTGKALPAPPGYYGEMYSVAISPDGAQLAVSGLSLVQWDVKAGRPLASSVASGRPDLFRQGLAYSPDGTLLAFSANNQEVWIWDLKRQSKLTTLKADAYSLAFSADGSMLAASADDDNMVTVWNTKSGLKTNTFSSTRPTGIAFSPDGKLLAAGQVDGHILIWDLKGGKPQTLTAPGSRDANYSSNKNSVAFSPDGKLLVTAANGGDSVFVWDTQTWQQSNVLHVQSPESIAFSPDGSVFAVASGGYVLNSSDPHSPVYIFEAATGDRLAVLQGHMRYVRGVTFSPDGSILASTGDDGTVVLWGVPASAAVNVGTPTATPIPVASPGAAQPTVQPTAPSTAPLTPAEATAVAPAATVPMATPPLQVISPVNADRLNMLVSLGRGLINGLAWSPDSKTIALAGSIGIWWLDPANPSEPLSKVSSQNSIAAVAYSPDGSLIATSGDGSPWLLDARTGQPVRQLRGNGGNTAIAFSPDGSLVAASNWDSTVTLWNAKSASSIATLKGHNGAVRGMAFSPDGSLIASAGDDQTVRLWDVKSQQLKTALQTKDDEIFAVVFSPDGTLLAAVGSNTIRVWDVATGKPAFEASGSSALGRGAAFSPDGKTLAVATSQGVELWNVKARQTTGKVWKTTSLALVADMSYSPDGTKMAVARTDGTLEFWDATTGKNITTVQSYTGAVNWLSFSPDNQLLSAGGNNSNNTLIWDLKTGQPESALRAVSPIPSVFSPDGSLLAVGSTTQDYQTTVSLLDVKTGTSKSSIPSVGSGIAYRMMFSPNGNYLAINYADAILLWDIKVNRLAHTLTSPSGGIDAMAFSYDGALIASADEDNMVRLWDIKTGKTIGTLNGLTNRLGFVAFSPDDSTVVAYGVPYRADKTVWLWDVKTGQVKATIDNLSSSVTRLVFSPDSSTFAIATEDGLVQLRDTRSGQPVTTLQTGINGGGNADGLAFSPDGKLLVASSGPMQLWDVRTGKLLATFYGHNGGAETVAFNADGTLLASGGWDGTVIIWGFHGLLANNAAPAASTSSAAATAAATGVANGGS